MKKEYITPQTLVMRAETTAPIAASGEFTVTIEDGDDYTGEFYSKSNSLWADDNDLWADDEE